MSNNFSYVSTGCKGFFFFHIAPDKWQPSNVVISNTFTRWKPTDKWQNIDDNGWMQQFRSMCYETGCSAALRRWSSNEQTNRRLCSNELLLGMISYRLIVLKKIIHLKSIFRCTSALKHGIYKLNVIQLHGLTTDWFKT